MFQEVFLLTLKRAYGVGKFIGSKSCYMDNSLLSLKEFIFADQQCSMNLLECIFANQQLREVCANFFLAVKGKNTEENSVKLSSRKKIMGLKKSSTKTD